MTGRRGPFLPVVVLTAREPSPEERARLDGLIARALRTADYRLEDIFATVRHKVGRASVDVSDEN